MSAAQHIGSDPTRAELDLALLAMRIWDTAATLLLSTLCPPPKDEPCSFVLTETGALVLACERHGLTDERAARVVRAYFSPSPIPGGPERLARALRRPTN